MSPTKAALAFERTIPRHLVHRDAVHEVLLTDAVDCGDERYAVACQLSRSHPLFGDRRGGWHDLLMLMEAGRQATVVIAHEFCGVSRDWAFIANEMKAVICDPAPMFDGDSLLEATLEMNTSERRYRDDGVLAAMRFAVTVEISDRTVAEMGGGLMFMPAPDYRELRRRVREGKRLDGAPSELPERLPAASVGRFDERNVVIGPSRRRFDDQAGNRFEMVVDRGHPSLFDHPLDHVPAIFLLEALRQAALVAVTDTVGLEPDRVMPVACEARFDDFVELEMPVECVAAAGGRENRRVEVELSVVQEERRIATAAIELLEPR